METVANARIQRYIFSTRATIGVRIVTLEEAGRELLAALRRNEPVGLVADRDLTGGGIEVELFGAHDEDPGRAGPAGGRDRRAGLHVGRAADRPGPLSWQPATAASRRRERVGGSAAGPWLGRKPGSSNGSSSTRRNSGWPSSTRSGPTWSGPPDARQRRRRVTRASRPARGWVGPTCTSTRSPRTGRHRRPRSSTTPRTAPTST